MTMTRTPRMVQGIDAGLTEEAEIGNGARRPALGKTKGKKRRGKTVILRVQRRHSQRTRTHPYEHTHANPTPMSIFEDLNAL
uniref:Uncharacterized protein n=1 Tax=Oryza glumipatula TaxID=40148 RepID=A0A0D9ZZ25_9ORYZ